MPELTDAYLDATEDLVRLTARCRGLVVDVQQRQEALSRWQAGIENRASIDVIEMALREFAAGEPPSWGAVRSALDRWVEATERVHRLWDALSAEERALLAPPLVRFASDAAGG